MSRLVICQEVRSQTDRQTDRQTDDGSDWIDDGSEEWFKTYPGSFNWDSSLWLEELKLLRFKYLYNKQTACYSKSYQQF